MNDRYYITVTNSIDNPLKGWEYEIRDGMAGSSANTDRMVSVHENKELAVKLCRLANSAWRDVIYQANFSERT